MAESVKDKAFVRRYRGVLDRSCTPEDARVGTKNKRRLLEKHACRAAGCRPQCDGDFIGSHPDKKCSFAILKIEDHTCDFWSA
jgi:hypothetical protein